MTKTTLENVRAAVAHLESTGARVTVISVRAVHKDGSATTITQLLRHVRRTKAMAEELSTSPGHGGRPYEVAKKMAELIRNVA